MDGGGQDDPGRVRLGTGIEDAARDGRAPAIGMRPEERDKIDADASISADMEAVVDRATGLLLRRGVLEYGADGLRLSAGFALEWMKAAAGAGTLHGTIEPAVRKLTGVGMGGTAASAMCVIVANVARHTERWGLGAAVREELEILKGLRGGESVHDVTHADAAEAIRRARKEVEGDLP